jgi:hypothetical protein
VHAAMRAEGVLRHPAAHARSGSPASPLRGERSPPARNEFQKSIPWPSFPRKREPRASDRAVPPGPPLSRGRR